MAQSGSKIISDIEKYIKGTGGDMSSWCVGQSANPKDRLFKTHGVDIRRDSWIFAFATSWQNAEKILEYFASAGAETKAAIKPGRGIYAFRKSERTNPPADHIDFSSYGQGEGADTQKLPTLGFA